MLLLYFPKFVLIRNGRLHVLYYICMAGVVVCVIYNFISARLWTTALPLSDYLWVSLRVTGDPAASAAAWPQRSNVAPCSASSGSASTCTPLCEGNAEVPDGCVRWQETYSEGSGTVFFATAVEDDLASSVSGSGRRHGLLPSVLDLGLRLSIGYKLPQRGWLSAASSDGGGDWASAEVGTTHDRIRTVLLDKGGKPRRTFDPSKGIDVSLSEVLDLAGEGPALGHLGLEVSLNAQCYDTDRAGVADNWPGPVCYVMFVASPLPGHVPQESVVEGSDGSLRARTFTGIRIIARTSGSFAVRDFNRLFVNIASIFVFLTFPMKVVMIVAVSMLGSVSSVYSKALFECFDVQQLVGSITARVIAHSTTFLELADCDTDHNWCKAGISRKRASEMLRDVVKSGWTRKEAPTEDDLERLVDFCFYALLSDQTSGVMALLSDMKAEVSSIVGYAKEEAGKRAMRLSGGTPDGQRGRAQGVFAELDDQVVDLYRFTNACASSDLLAFQDVVTLMDPHRKRGCMETLFTPTLLRKIQEDQLSSLCGKGLSPSKQSQRLPTMSLDEPTPNSTAVPPALELRDLEAAGDNEEKGSSTCSSASVSSCGSQISASSSASSATHLSSSGTWTWREPRHLTVQDRLLRQRRAARQVATLARQGEATEKMLKGFQVRLGQLESELELRFAAALSSVEHLALRLDALAAPLTAKRRRNKKATKEAAEAAPFGDPVEQTVQGTGAPSNASAGSGEEAVLVSMDRATPATLGEPALQSQPDLNMQASPLLPSPACSSTDAASPPLPPPLAPSDSAGDDAGGPPQLRRTMAGSPGQEVVATLPSLGEQADNGDGDRPSLDTAEGQAREFARQRKKQKKRLQFASKDSIESLCPHEEVLGGTGDDGVPPESATRRTRRKARVKSAGSVSQDLHGGAPSAKAFRKQRAATVGQELDRSQQSTAQSQTRTTTADATLLGLSHGASKWAAVFSSIL